MLSPDLVVPVNPYHHLYSQLRRIKAVHMTLVLVFQFSRLFLFPVLILFIHLLWNQSQAIPCCKDSVSLPGLFLQQLAQYSLSNEKFGEKYLKGFFKPVSYGSFVISCVVSISSIDRYVSLHLSLPVIQGQYHLKDAYLGSC